ncbi:MAG: AI-2E family transporter [Acidithiobacillus sp.]|nr:AI-2E family transporter [Acidithiobacillus sp.]
MSPAREEIRFTSWGTVALALIYVGAAYTLSPYAAPLLMGTVLTVVGWPWQRRLERVFHLPRWFASFCHAAAWMAIIIVPAVLVVESILPEISRLVARWQSGGPLLGLPLEVVQLPYLGHWLAARVAQLNGADVSLLLQDHAAVITSSLGQLWIFVLHTFFVALTVFALGLHAPRLAEILRLLASNLWGPERGERFLLAMREATRSVVIGLIGVGVIEGILIGIAYGVAGLSAWPLWLVVTALLSPIPFGATVVVAAATFWLIIGGHWVEGVVVLSWGLFVITLADLVIRPLLTGSQSQAPFFLVFFSILGGAAAFGLIGLIIGPILVLMARAVWRAWERRILLEQGTIHASGRSN